MTMIYVLAAMALAGLVAAMAFAPRRELVTQITIDASPQQVWAVLADGASYPEWNPFIRRMAGEVKVGARLENTLEPAPGKKMTFRPVVMAAEEGRELRWLGRLGLPRIFDGEHYFRLEPAGRGTRLLHGERFSGILLWLMDVERFRANFEAMNRALKERVENGR